MDTCLKSFPFHSTSVNIDKATSNALGAFSCTFLPRQEMGESNSWGGEDGALGVLALHLSAAAPLRKAGMISPGWEVWTRQQIRQPLLNSDPKLQHKMCVL